MRPLNLVLEAIGNVAKQHSFDKKSEFLTELIKIEGSCSVEDLNANKFLWAEVSGVLKKYLEPLDTEWKKTISELYLGRKDHTKYL